MDDPDKWLEHTAMTDPAEHAAALAGFPTDIGVLNRTVQGLLLHSEWLADYGIDPAQLPADSRKTMPIADRLTDILGLDANCLDEQRPPHARSIGTCRDFALMLCSFLRCRGVPSRMRCGFAAYLGAGWEDHWVCEYWDERTRTWRFSDPQIDPHLKHKLRIAFDPANVPRRCFVTAGRAWLECRAKAADPDRFGHGDVTGWWFMKVNVIRDHYVLNGRETSDWDGWRKNERLRDKSSLNVAVSRHDTAWLDDIAAQPGQPLVESKPDWLE